MTLTDIPTEVFTLICQQCSPGSLRNLRLVNKRAHAVSTPLIFRRLYLAPFSPSIDRMLSLSRSSICKHVNAIDFIPDRLPDWSCERWSQSVSFKPSFQKWRQSVIDSEGPRDPESLRDSYQKLPMHTFTLEEMKRGLQAYRAVTNQQNFWRADSDGLLLKECLSSLPNLEEAVIQKAKPMHGSLNKVPFWKHLRRSILIGPDQWIFDHSTPGRDPSDGTYALAFLQAIGYRNTFSGVRKVEKMLLDLTMECSLSTLIALIEPTADQTARLELVKEAFRPLKYLEISCPCAPDFIAEDGEQQGAEVQELIRASVKLEVLHLEYGDPRKHYFQEGQSRISLLPFFSNEQPTFPHLRELKITAAVPGDAFAKFLSLHSQTLRRLDMRDCVSDDWEAVLVTISRSLHLDEIYLECLHDYARLAPATFDRNDDDHDSDDDPEVIKHAITHFWQGIGGAMGLSEAMRVFLLEGQGEIPEEYYEEDT